MEENEKKENGAFFATLTELHKRWKDGTFQEIIDDWKWIFSYSARHKKAIAFYVILGCWEGYVALFEKGSEEPRQIFHCPIASLPLLDQQALEEGIIVRNETQLQQLLEDYLS